MKVKLISIILLGFLLSSCGGGSNQSRQGFYAIPCKDRAGNSYYLNENGEWLQNLSQTLESLDLGRWWEPGFFQDGLLRVDSRNGNDRICMFLDSAGNVKLDVYNTVFKQLFPEKPEYAKCTDFSQGIAFVRDGSLLPKSYAIDKSGKVLFELEGTPISGFNEKGQAFFRNPSGHNGVISKSGEILMEPNENIYENPYHLPPVGDCVNYRLDNKVALMKFEGKGTAPLSFQLMIPDENGCVVICDFEGRWGIATVDGKVLCSTDYKHLENDGKYYYFLTKDNRAGWCDKNGNVVIGPIGENVNQAKRSRYEGLPRPFYGSKWSVGTITTVDDFRDYAFHSACMTEDELKKMGDTYDPESVSPKSTVSGIAISPMVNGRTIITNKKGQALVYSFESGALTEHGDDRFVPKYGYYEFNIWGLYVMNPVTQWKGF